ncbi:protein Brevis radix-like 4 [Chenopodium quinoa]|uniref:BRX domain-containing protein n=1 Tax=Chenopodium quinoa TaxID=63459 RepID=A0A803MG96_CHEQI|nr:protein Brevis radix-like 4 [Chenopodium quinoa]
MLTCIARPKHQQGHHNSVSHHHQHDDPDSVHTPNSKQAIKTLTSQIKGIALKASGAYKCNPCSHPNSTGAPGSGPGQLKKYAESETGSGSGSGSEKLKPPRAFKRTLSANSSSSAATPRWGKEMEARLKGLSVGGEVTPVMSVSASGRRVDPVVLVEEDEPKEWVAQVEPGVLITFVSLPRGGNDLKRIRFNRDMFNKWQAQKWWTDNYEKIMELYNVQRLSRNAFPLPTPPRSEDENSSMNSKMMESSIGDSPVTPPLCKESRPRNLYRGMNMGMGYSSSDSFEQHSKQSRQYESSGLASTPKHSNISGVTVKTELSSMDESLRSTSSREGDRSGELSISNASDMESEWVEEDEPGVYITIRALPGGRRELRRVRFSREKFGEMHARVWWEENRARIHEQYL